MRASAGNLTSMSRHSLLAAAWQKELKLSQNVLQAPAIWGQLFWSVQKQQP